MLIVMILVLVCSCFMLASEICFFLLFYGERTYIVKEVTGLVRPAPFLIVPVPIGWACFLLSIKASFKHGFHGDDSILQQRLDPSCPPPVCQPFCVNLPEFIFCSVLVVSYHLVFDYCLFSCLFKLS